MQIPKKTAFLFFAVFIVAAITLVATLHSKGQSNKQQPKKREREYSRQVYKGLGAGHEKLSDKAAKANNDLITTLGRVTPVLSPFPTAPMSLQEYLGGRVCAADAVVIAIVKSKTPQLTEDDTFILTNHKMKVEEVLKNNADASIQPNDSIKVARIGGTITLYGHNVTASYEAFKPLEVGERYLLFLNFLPEKGEYVSNGITYLLKNDKIAKLADTKDYKELEDGNSTNGLVNEIRIAASNICADEAQGGANQ